MSQAYADSFIECIARLAGEEAAALFQRHFGGTRFHVPAQLNGDTQLSRLLGQDAANKIIEEWSGVSVDVPLGDFSAAARRSRDLERLCLAGGTAHEIARKAGCTERAVSAARRRLREAGHAVPVGARR